MALVDQINKDIKQAMLAKESQKLSALRAVKSELLLLATKTADAAISEEDEMKVIKKMVKQRKDSAAIFEEQGREDLAADEKFQLEVLSVYMPEQMAEADVEKVVSEMAGKVGATGPSDMGKLMGVVMKELNGKADGKVISSIVKKVLAS